MGLILFGVGGGGGGGGGGWGRVTHIESLKFPTNPGLSPGVGLRKQGLLALQMMPCTQGNVPAEGMALLGK